MPSPRFLIVRIAALGDIAVASTLLTRIRSEHPSAHITWLCGETAVPLLAAMQRVDEILAVNESALFGAARGRQALEVLRVWRQLIGKRFDRVVVVHADTRYRMLVVPTWPARVSTLSHDARNQNPLPSRFRGDEYARLLDDGVSKGPVTRRYDMIDLRSVVQPAPLAEGARERVVLVPGGARNALRDDVLRRWPPQSFRLLAERLLAEGYEVVLLGDSRDAYVRAHFSGLPVTDCLGTLTIPEALQLLRGARVVVAADTGPLHLARLVRTPVIALFGPTDPRHVVGDNGDVRVLWGGAELPCRPCYDGKNYAACTNNLCMKSITVNAAYQAVISMLNAARLTPA
jgi:heptosyltransferase-2